MERLNPQENASNIHRSLQAQVFHTDKTVDKIHDLAPDYSQYNMERKEVLKLSVIPVAEIIVISFLCYDNLVFSLFLLPYIPFFIKDKKKKIIADRKWKLNMQFGEGISCISAALEAGYSVENALKEAYNDLKLTYSEDEIIMKELVRIIAYVRNNGTVEDGFSNLAKRSGVEDVRSFADIFSTTKRTGGNLIRVISATSDVIRTRVELKRELKTIIASKKYESDVMKLVPVFMIAYLKFFSSDMIANLYGNLSGIVTMTILLFAYLGLCKVSDYIVKIEL